MKAGSAMYMPEHLLLALWTLLWLLGWSLLSYAEGPNLGTFVTAAEAQRWSISVWSDGKGLPPGSGTVASGAGLYATHCQHCHGPGGIGLTADALAGAEEPLNSAWPDKTIGSYWPYASTLFDFIRRAKPMSAPSTLTSDQVYALSAYLFHLNGLLDADETLTAAQLARIKMPNRQGFSWIDAQP